MKRLLSLLIVAAALWVAPAYAQEGSYERDNCDQLPSPVDDKTWCKQRTTASGRTAGHEYVRQGGIWVDMAGVVASVNFSNVQTGTNANALAVSGSLAPSGAGTITANRTGCTGDEYLKPDGTCGAAGGGGAGTPGGSDTQVQYNDGGNFGGDAGLTYNETTNVLTASGGFVGNLSGNTSGTAGSLAANGANCSAGSFPLGVDASGAAESCTDAATQAELNTHDANASAHSAGIAGTASALAANGANCSAGSAPLGVDASGAAESCTDYVEASLIDAASGVVGTDADNKAIIRLQEPTVATLPVTPGSGRFVWIIDGNGSSDCSEGGGSERVLCAFNPDTLAWEAVGGGGTFTEADTLQSVFARAPEITGANSLANAVRIGDGVNPGCSYTDVSTGFRSVPCTPGNIRSIAMNGFTWGVYDDEAGADIETIDPDGASPKAIYTYGTAYKPLKSMWFGAGSLSTDGSQCADPAEVTINSGPKIWTIICTDNDGSTIYGSVKMPDAWDAGTVTFTHSYIQTAANTGALNGDIAAQCRGNGEVPSSTWGTEIAIDDAAVVGSNSNDFTTSAAVTPAGTCAAGDMLYFRYQLDATGTTTTIASLHHVGFLMKYSVTSRSD